MEIKKTVEKKCEEILDIVCNKCGRSLKDDISGEYIGLTHGLYECRGGGDPCCMFFALCDECVDNLVDTFKIAPEVVE